MGNFTVGSIWCVHTLDLLVWIFTLTSQDYDVAVRATVDRLLNCTGPVHNKLDRPDLLVVDVGVNLLGNLQRILEAGIISCQDDPFRMFLRQVLPKSWPPGNSLITGRTQHNRYLTSVGLTLQEG